MDNFIDLTTDSDEVTRIGHLQSCQTCRDLSNHETKLKQHNWSKHHWCVECQLHFTNHWKTARHLLEVHQIQARCPFGCDFLIFAPDIKLHMKYKHKLWTLQKNGDCIFCSRKFHNGNQLNLYIDRP